MDSENGFTITTLDHVLRAWKIQLNLCWTVRPMPIN